MRGDTDKPAALRDLHGAFGAALAISSGLALYYALSIVAALAESRLLDPRAVARWADFFAQTLPADPAPEAQSAIRGGVAGFAVTLRAMAELPPGSGRA